HLLALPKDLEAELDRGGVDHASEDSPDREGVVPRLQCRGREGRVAWLEVDGVDGTLEAGAGQAGAEAEGRGVVSSAVRRLCEQLGLGRWELGRRLLRRRGPRYGDREGEGSWA